jgi:hypothetical protein
LIEARETEHSYRSKIITLLHYSEMNIRELYIYFDSFGIFARGYFYQGVRALENGLFVIMYNRYASFIDDWCRRDADCVT